MVTFNIPADCL